MLTTWGRRALLAAVLALAAVNAPSAAPAEADASKEVARGCPPERALNGEVRLVFLGDSGYGEGFSEWGTHGQDAIAERLAQLTLPPDLVFFLGDNIYWRGNADLYKSRFDDVYDPLIRDCKVHVALGNHDIMGCRDDPKSNRGEANLGGYCNKKLDELADQVLQESDANKRDLLIKQAYEVAAKDFGYIPLHQQALAWGVSKKVKLNQRADNQVLLYWATKQE